MNRKGKPLYQLCADGIKDPEQKKSSLSVIYLMRTRCISWITSNFAQYKIPIITAFCLLLIMLYHVYNSMRSISPNTPFLLESHSTNALSFLVIGDWGACHAFENAFKNQTNVANAMLSIHKKYNTNFVVSVGDHFYEHGLISSRDPKWQTCFEEVYDISLSPWFVSFGNHDVRGSIEAQIEYTRISPNKRWIAPSSYYSKDFNIPNSGQKFRVIFLDTNNLMCNHEEHTMLDALEIYECDEMFYKLPDLMQAKHHTNAATAEAVQNYNFKLKRAVQLQWFREEVQTANDDEEIKFVLVVGHHALFSQGPHKIPKEFNRKIQPILRSSKKIIAWFCGHNHALEHYIWDREKHANNKEMEYTQMHQFLSGSGGKEVHPMKSKPVESVLDDVQLGFLGKTFGFVSVHLEESYMRVNYWNQYGDILYSFDVEYPDS